MCDYIITLTVSRGCPTYNNATPPIPPAMKLLRKEGSLYVTFSAAINPSSPHYLLVTINLMYARVPSIKRSVH